MSLALTQLSGFGAGNAKTAFLFVGGTNIGNHTSNGGLAAAFDGNTNQAIGSTADRASGLANGFIGKNMGAQYAIKEVLCFGSNNEGYFAGGFSLSTTLELRASNSAPSVGNEGVLLGSITFTEVANESTGRLITSSDQATPYQYVWVYIIIGSTSEARCVAELQFQVFQ